jgi:hypothetical protein
MTNQATIEDLIKSQDAAMRVTARALIKHHNNNIEDFIEILGWELSKHVDDFARRTGDYDRASKLNIIADHLMKLDDAIDNYDGAPLE